MNTKIRFAILGMVILGFAFTNKAEATFGAEDMFNYVAGHPNEADNPVERSEAEQNCPGDGPVCAINTDESNETILWKGSLNKF